MSKLSELPLKLLIAAASFFALTFTVYFFNLDMKLTSKIEPLLIKHYDTMPRNTYL
jgi:hypothetical protein